ncbi:MAG: 2-hydroxyacid dehydrogenase [Ramlibacter sp.]|jgi:hydroxypyruvate reductase|uniref:2-hydroxyacid dehydrogenase n=1 Tax=Ramlibacter sp. TaxID=1917967 RepID=UPI0026379A2C|nr:2-hydroxyacid dehydrogenase [Ramlibacter sp.]MDB5751579.1 2-hydroxyacid dehydrogenase [Ramlibacter sp.]
MSAIHCVLQSVPLPPALEQQLSAACAQRGAPLLPPGSDPGDSGDHVTVLVTHASAGASADMIAQLPALRAICSLGVGLDAIDLDAAARRGIVVSNTPDVLTECVADLAMGLLIDVARGISAADRLVRRGDWARSGPPGPATRVSGKRLALLGMGRIAQAIATRAGGFRMEVRYHSRSAKPELAWRHEAALAQLADWADFLVVACAGGPATHHLVSAQVLQRLGPRGFLVNIARGCVVDQTALVAALQQGALAGAALDVFEDEPRVPPELLALDNVVLLPHVGSATRETRSAMALLLLDNLQSFLEHGELVTPAG